MPDQSGTTIFSHFDTRQSFREGEKVFSAGDMGDCLYAVIEGEVDVVIGDSVVETVGVNGIFGEMALLDAKPRSATVVARTDCLLARVDESEFRRQVHRNPFFALEVMRTMVRRLRQADTKFSGE